VIGYTSKSPSERLEEHNNKTNKWTGQNGPFTLLYSETIERKQDAIHRERFLKSGQGRKWLAENGY
jgi:putative endonuclease